MNTKTYILITLAILTFISKEVLVFNEEILVLFAFSVFTYLIYNFASNMIALELDTRGNKIEEEFLAYRNIQEKTLTHLISYHNKQKLLCEEIKNILLLTKKDIEILTSNYTQTFAKTINTNIEDRLKKVSANESKFNSLLQNKISEELYTFLISNYTSSKNKKNSSILLKNSINILSQMK